MRWAAEAFSMGQAGRAPRRERAAVTEPREAILLDVAYDGASFAGFALQPGQSTVAGSLLAAAQTLDPTVQQVRGASRTDSGVHARGQRVAFDVCRDIELRGWTLGLQRNLPQSIGVQRATRMPVGYNPRFDTVTKRYRYLLSPSRVHNPLLAGRAWRLPQLASAEARQRLEAEWHALEGTWDFVGFSSAKDERTNTVRRLERLTVGSQGPCLSLDVTGDGFLYNMVRIMVGTAVDVARERLAPGAVERTLASRLRTDAGMTAPAHGLYLEHVTLETPAERSWPPLSDGTAGSSR